MAMPRPSGKAQKIAEKVIPGLSSRSHKKGKSSFSKKRKDGVEITVVDVNNSAGKIPGKFNGPNISRHF